LTKYGVKILLKQIQLLNTIFYAFSTIAGFSLLRRSVSVTP